MEYIPDAISLDALLEDEDGEDGKQNEPAIPDPCELVVEREAVVQACVRAGLSETQLACVIGKIRGERTENGSGNITAVRRKLAALLTD